MLIRALSCIQRIVCNRTKEIPFVLSFCPHPHSISFCSLLLSSSPFNSLLFSPFVLIPIQFPFVLSFCPHSHSAPFCYLPFVHSFCPGLLFSFPFVLTFTCFSLFSCAEGINTPAFVDYPESPPLTVFDYTSEKTSPLIVSCVCTL